MGWGLGPLHFSSKDFEILDLDPPNYPTSHYDACHFGYNLALNHFLILIMYFFFQILCLCDNPLIHPNKYTIVASAVIKNLIQYSKMFVQNIQEFVKQRMRKQTYI